jgi:hypothetical protein
LVERYVDIVEVAGSSPVLPTKTPGEKPPGVFLMSNNGAGLG